ncbi:MAG TPA: tetratricopeptide repeat protein [Blastocatellia bacterium]|nr:tetratricopeptide repeat protein [Blastocatellia bacterium]
MPVLGKTILLNSLLILLPACSDVPAQQTPSSASVAAQQSNGDAELAELRRAVEAAAGQTAKLRAARFAYAQALSQAGRDEEAAAQYREVIRENGGRDPIACYNLGNVYARARRNEQAAEAYTEAIRQRFGHYSRAQNNLGLMLVRLGRFAEAREAFQKAIAEERGGFADAHYNLAQLYAQQEDLKAARAETAAALRLDPQHEDARLLAEQLRFDLSTDRNESETVIAAGAKPAAASPVRIVKVTPETFHLLAEARTARARSDYNRAVTLYQSALRTEGASVPAIEWELAAILMRLDQAREAEEAYRRLIAEAGDRYPMAYYYAGRAMMKQQKFGAAAVMLRQALARVGEAPYIYLALADSLEHLEDYEGAIQTLEKYNQYRLARAVAGEEITEDDWYKGKMASLNEKRNRAGRQ